MKTLDRHFSYSAEDRYRLQTSPLQQRAHEHQTSAGCARLARHKPLAVVRAAATGRIRFDGPGLRTLRAMVLRVREQNVENARLRERVVLAHTGPRLQKFSGWA
jgi:hypothetical protein